jgi:hypothetical protein
MRACVLSVCGRQRTHVPGRGCVVDVETPDVKTLIGRLCGF